MAKDAQTVQMAVKERKNVGGKMQVVDGIRELSLDKLNRKPLADFYRMAGKFVNVENYVYEATALYDAGSPITTEHTIDLFEKGYAEELGVPNSGRVIQRQGENLTNMSTDGEFDNGTAFLLSMISVDIFPTAEPATLVTNGAIIEPATAPVNNYSFVNHFKALSRQFRLEFIRGEKQVMVEGKLYQFPSPFTASGAIGASAGGFMQNGFSVPTWNKLKEIHVLKSQQRFRFRITPLVNGFTPQVPVEIKVLLIGMRITEQYA